MEQDTEIRSAFESSVDEGRRRLSRSLPALLATGTVGGIDLGIGVLALLVVMQATDDRLLAALAFGIGFIALTLAGSELFTENFLVPVAAVVAGKSSWGSVVRLWAGTFVMNVVGGWVITGLTVAALPHLRATAVAVGGHYPEMGIGWEAFAAALLGGAAITMLTWMQRTDHPVTADVIGAVGVAFVLAAPPLNHAVVSSLEMLAALHAGAPFGYADWAGAAAWAALGNLVGGLGLVTMVRFVQVGREVGEDERDRPPDAPREAPPADEAPVGDERRRPRD